NEDEFDAIREGILDKLSVVIPLIATGAPEDEIYAKWAEITADDMAVPHEYPASANLPVADSTAIAASVNDVERPVPEQHCTDIFMTVDNGEQPLVPTMLKSIDAHASQPYRVWLPSSALDLGEVDELQTVLSNGSVHILAPVYFDGIANTNALVQALLPELFPEHERMVVVTAG